MEDDRKSVGTKDQALLSEIRERFQYARQAWEEVRKERQIDLRYLCGQPWEDEDLRARKDAGRPAINHDELNQYVNQGVNNLRQNKRGIKVEPRGNGADEKSATLRQDKIRTIEYRSKAQDVYLRAAQDMFEGSYGFFRVSREYAIAEPESDDPRAFDQEIVLKPIPNPDSVLYDPDAKEADWSDAGWCFIVEPMSREEFKRRFGSTAEIVDFTSEDLRVATGWINDKTVMVAEYWKVETTVEKLKRGNRSRSIERKQVCQYITNGIEILDQIEQPGREIPIPAMIGQERYVGDEGGGYRRKLFSLARLGRDPQMSLAYLCSQQMEEAGLSPKVPVRGWQGQFEADRQAHQDANKIPVSFLEYTMPEWALERGIALPLPQQQPFTPNFEQYEVAKDSCRRAIQAAMGISPLPTAAQRDNEKSGVALENIQTAEAIGSLHFSAGFDRALARAGRIIDSWMPVVYDTEREEWLHQANESRRKVRINTEEPYLDEETGQPAHYPIGSEDHDISVSTGPSYESQRDAVSQFLDNLIANLPKLPLAPPQAQKLLAMAIRMKELGPRGDELAEIVDPEQQNGAQQMLQGLQAQQAQQQQIMAEMQAELQKLQLERAGKVIDNQFRMDIERMKIEAQAAQAEINTKAQIVSERAKFVEDLWAQLHGQAHEAGMQAQDQLHEQNLSSQQQQHEQGMADQQAAIQQQQQPQVQQ